MWVVVSHEVVRWSEDVSNGPISQRGSAGWLLMPFFCLLA